MCECAVQVVFLELLLGTSEVSQMMSALWCYTGGIQVFQIDERTKAIINHRLRRSSLREAPAPAAVAPAPAAVAPAPAAVAACCLAAVCWLQASWKRHTC